MISLDIDASLVRRAGARHAEHGIGNVTVHLADGFAGWAPDAPYHRIIAWATPPLLPHSWVRQAADQAVIGTPVEVAPLAGAHLLLRADLRDGQPVARDVHPGGFIQMHSEVITAFAVPVRHCDALYQDGLHWDVPSVWLSAPALRDDPDAARHAAALIATGRAVTSPLGDDYATFTAFCGFLCARQPDGLASAGFEGAGFEGAGFEGPGPDCGSGLGIVLPDSAALIRPQDLHLAGTDRAARALRALIAEWDHHGRPAVPALRPRLLADPEGFSVRVDLPSAPAPSTHQATPG